MNGIQGNKPEGRKWNRIIHAAVKIVDYNKSTLERGIYVKIYYNSTVSYLVVLTDDVW